MSTSTTLRTKPFLFACLLFFVFISPTKAQEEDSSGVVKAIQFLSSDALAEINFDRAPFMDYMKRLMDDMEVIFGKMDQARDLLVEQTFHKNKAPSFRIYARPALDAKTEKKLLKKLLAIKGVQSTIVDFSLLYMIETDGGHLDKEADFVPDFLPPINRIGKAFEAADLKTKVQQVKKWAIEEAIPILANIANSVDPKFEGVQGMGKVLTENDFSKKVDVHQLTNANSDYWRATLEMSPGNQLIPMIKIAILASQGQLDWALKHAEIVRYFSSENVAIPNMLLEEFNWRMAILIEEVNSTVDKGILLHNEDKFDAAIKIYEKILADYPNSAFTQYELYFSKNTKAIEDGKQSLEDRADWDIAKKTIYACNPIYSMDVRAKNGREGWLLIRRQSISTLFKDKETYHEDFITYADIALDLGVYDFAAQLYWMLISSYSADDIDSQDALVRFLYCIDQLGDKTTKKNFKLDYKKIFRTLEEQLDATMKESSIYQSFEDKGK